jgi:hypothetical protein
MMKRQKRKKEEEEEEDEAVGLWTSSSRTWRLIYLGINSEIIGERWIWVMRLVK